MPCENLLDSRAGESGVLAGGHHQFPVGNCDIEHRRVYAFPVRVLQVLKILEGATVECKLRAIAFSSSLLAFAFKA
jgi:hypothetical protein